MAHAQSLIDVEVTPDETVVGAVAEPADSKVTPILGNTGLSEVAAKSANQNTYQTEAVNLLDWGNSEQTHEPYPYHRITQQKLQWTYSHVASFDTIEDFREFFAQLKHLDTDIFQQFGGLIFEAVRDKHDPLALQDFDDRYLTLIQLMAHANLSLAIRFHDEAEFLSISHANSLIRYARLKTALQNTQTALENQQASGATLARISPVMERGIRHQLIPLTDFKSELKNISESDAVQWHLPLSKTYDRRFSRLSVKDDTRQANRLWIDPTFEKPVDLFTVLCVPKVRICRAPTGISWLEKDEYRFRFRNSDMYHYFRMSGTTAYSPVKRHLQLAYFLPRIGNRNHYHSLVDKLPALLGYKLLGLDCPIVSTFELDATEIYFCKKLGIDPDAIIADTHGELIADRGIIADAESLRAPFYEYCRSMQMPKMRYGKKIYISRAGSKDRPMANEAEVHSMMLSMGFGIVAMENYSLTEQISIAQNADVIVSPHGAGLSNMVFAKAGTAILELIPDKYMTPLFKQLAIDCNHRYSTLLGSVDNYYDAAGSDLRWTVDVQKIKSVLETL